MREHHHHHAVVLQHAARFGENALHRRLVGGLRALCAAVAVRVGHGLVGLVGHAVFEVLRIEIAESALFPDIIEVRQLGVLNVVVVGRIENDRVDRAVGDALHMIGAAVKNLQRRLPLCFLKNGFGEIGQPLIRVQDLI